MFPTSASFRRALRFSAIALNGLQGFLQAGQFGFRRVAVGSRLVALPARRRLLLFCSLYLLSECPQPGFLDVHVARQGGDLLVEILEPLLKRADGGLEFAFLLVERGEPVPEDAESVHPIPPSFGRIH